jgi:hypothetical protein
MELGANGEVTYRPDLTSDKRHVDGIIAEYREALSSLAYLAFDPGLITLRVLHRFDRYPKLPERSGKADIAGRGRHVCFVPKADIPQSASVYVVRTCPLRTTRRPRRGRKGTAFNYHRPNLFISSSLLGALRDFWL